MIKPTVGRKVWYRHDKSPVLLGDNKYLQPSQISDQPMDATVVYVWDDRMVNLHVMDHYGNVFNRTSVKLLQDDDAIPEKGGYAEWMPYQQGQARVAGQAPIVAQGAGNA